MPHSHVPPPASVTTAFSNQQSILMRPLKSRGKHNEENSQMEYDREQKRLESRRARFNQLYENRRVSLWGDTEEKKNLQERRRQEIDHHLNIREQAKKIELLRDIQIVNQSKQTEDTLRRVEHAQEQIKKQYLRQIMEDNKKLMEYKKQQQIAERQQDIERERNQIEFFDRHRSYR